MINHVKRCVDGCMLVVLMVLMAFQVTELTIHEWLGMAMVVLVIVHQVLNRKWYGALLKGRYRGYRMVTTAVTLLLLASFVMTAVSGLEMSRYAVKLLYRIGHLSDPQTWHMAMSHWTFIFMGLHLGLHLPAMLGRRRLSSGIKAAVVFLAAAASGYGLYLFVQNGIIDDLLFRMHFAFFDDTPAPLVIVNNLFMLIPWTAAGTLAALFFRRNPART